MNFVKSEIITTKTFVSNLAPINDFSIVTQRIVHNNATATVPLVPNQSLQ